MLDPNRVPDATVRVHLPGRCARGGQPQAVAVGQRVHLHLLPRFHDIDRAGVVDVLYVPGAGRDGIGILQRTNVARQRWTVLLTGFNGS